MFYAKRFLSSANMANTATASASTSGTGGATVTIDMDHRLADNADYLKLVISDLRKSWADTRRTVVQRNRAIADRDATIMQQEATIASRNKSIATWRQRSNENFDQAQRFEKVLKEQNAVLAALQANAEITACGIDCIESKVVEIEAQNIQLTAEQVKVVKRAKVLIKRLKDLASLLDEIPPSSHKRSRASPPNATSHL